MPSIITIPTDLLFFPYKSDLKHYYQKYWRKGGNYLWMGNHPIAIFAEYYLKCGKNILDDLDSHIFIKYEYDRYSDAETVKDDRHKYNAANRVIKMVESIKKHGYCQGKYDKSKHLIRAYKTSNHDRYSPDKKSYVLKSRKHRAAVCCALGYKQVKIKVV